MYNTWCKNINSGVNRPATVNNLVNELTTSVRPKCRKFYGDMFKLTHSNYSIFETEVSYYQTEVTQQ